MEWKTVDDLLGLFSITETCSGVTWFGRLVELQAVYTAYPEFGISYGDIIRYELRRLHCSPLVYWSQQRRALRPLLAADAETLRALGLDVPDDFNCADIARAAAASWAAHGEFNREYAELLAPRFRNDG